MIEPRALREARRVVGVAEIKYTTARVWARMEALMKDRWAFALAICLGILIGWVVLDLVWPRVARTLAVPEGAPGGEPAARQVPVEQPDEPATAGPE